MGNTSLTIVYHIKKKPKYRIVFEFLNLMTLVFILPFLYLYCYDNTLKICYQTFKNRRIEIPDPIEPIKIPITNKRAIISGLNNSGEIIERF